MKQQVVVVYIHCFGLYALIQSDKQNKIMFSEPDLSKFIHFVSDDENEMRPFNETLLTAKYYI